MSQENNSALVIAIGASIELMDIGCSGAAKMLLEDIRNDLVFGTDHVREDIAQSGTSNLSGLVDFLRRRFWDGGWKRYEESNIADAAEEPQDDFDGAA